MTEFRREIELLIRAQLKGGRDIETITRSIKDLSDQIDRQAAAAKRGESAYDGMKAAAEALRAVQEELGARGKQLQRLNDLTKGLETQRDAVERARKALEAYEAANSGDRTVAQQKRVQSLTAAYQRSQNRLADLQRSQEILNTALRESGEDTSDLAGALRRVGDQQVAAASQQRRLNEELAQYSENVRKGREATAELARQQALLNRLQEGNEADARLGRIQREAAAINELARQQALLNRLQEGNEADARLGRDQQRANLARFQEGNEADASLGRQQRDSAASRDSGLRKQADDAAAAARGYTTLARASTNLRPKIQSLRDAVDSIINPAAKSRETLVGVEKQVQELSDAVVKSRGPVKDYADQFRNLQAAQKALASQAGAIDAFRNQLRALRDTRTELVTARGEVARYAAEVRKGGDAGLTFVKPLAEAQARLRAASAAMSDQVNATRQAREALRGAGIDTRFLDDAQTRLVNSTRTATNAVKQLQVVVEKNGVASSGASKGFRLFNDEGRTTLSLAQRLRGELLALAAAYVGLQGIGRLAADSIGAFNQREGLRNTLAFALGADGAQVGQEIEYIIRQAERLGISFEQASKGYAKFAASALKAGASIQETRFIFESFSEVARVINLSPDEINGLFNAIGQSFSKGKIQAEELRQQIGERLPGAFAFAQEALKDVFPNLDKALEQGAVGAEYLLLVAESVRKAAADQLPQAIRSLNAEQQRFNNSVLFFKQQVAEQGFADAYRDLLKELTDFLQSEDGTAFAKSVASAFKAVANAIAGTIAFARKYSAELQAIAVAITAAFALNVARSQITNFIRLIEAMTLSFKGSEKAATGFGRALQFVQRAFVVFQIAAIALDIAYYFTKNEDAARKFFNSFSDLAAITISHVKQAFETLSTIIPALLNDAVVKAYEKLPPQYRTLLEIGQALTGSKLGNADPVSPEKKLALIRAAGEAERAEIRRTARERDLRLGTTAVDSNEFGAPPADTTELDAARAELLRLKKQVDDKAVKKRLQEIEQVEAAVTALEAKALKKDNTTLQSLLDASAIEYRKLATDIAALGGTAGVEFAKRFAAALPALQAEITKDFNAKLLAEQESLQNKLDQLAAAAGRKDKESLQARIQAITDANKAAFADIAAFRAKLVANGRDTAPADAQQRDLEATDAELKRLEAIKFLKEELLRQDKSINDLLSARELAIKAIENEVAAGTINRDEADKQILTTIAQLEPEIQKATDAAIEFAIANKAAFDPNALQEFINKLREAQNSGKAMNVEFDRTGQIIRSGVGSGVDKAFDALIEGLKGVANETKDWGDVFEAVGRSILQTVADILLEIGKAIIKQQILNLLKGIGVPVPVAHSGMVVGQGSNRTRTVDSSWFAGAPRYHSGTVVGLAPNEVPAVLEEGEEVLSKSNPRNILNGGGVSSTGGPSSMRVVVVDDERKIKEALAGAEGEQVFLTHAKRNIPTLRALLKGG